MIYASLKSFNFDRHTSITQYFQSSKFYLPQYYIKLLSYVDTIIYFRFLRHLNRGGENSCARTDLTFKPVPGSALESKRQKKLRHQQEKEHEERERIAAQNVSTVSYVDNTSIVYELYKQRAIGLSFPCIKSFSDLPFRTPKIM